MINHFIEESNFKQQSTRDHVIIIIIIIINTLQHRNVDGLPATCTGSQTENLTT